MQSIFTRWKILEKNSISRKDPKKDLICICVTGSLPVAQNLGYMEVLDDGKEMNCGKNGLTRSIEKHADYDFTLHETQTSKAGEPPKPLRKMRFQFSETCSDLRIEYKEMSGNTTPVILYFQHKEDPSRKSQR